MSNLWYFAVNFCNARQDENTLEDLTKMYSLNLEKEHLCLPCHCQVAQQVNRLNVTSSRVFSPTNHLDLDWMEGFVLCIQNEPPFELFNGSFGSGRKCWRKSVFNFRLQENILPGWRVWYHILLTLYSSHSLYKPRDYKFNCISLFNRLILLRIWSYKTEDDDIADYI